MATWSKIDTLIQCTLVDWTDTHAHGRGKHVCVIFCIDLKFLFLEARDFPNFMHNKCTLHNKHDFLEMLYWEYPKPRPINRGVAVFPRQFLKICCKTRYFERNNMPKSKNKRVCYVSILQNITAAVNCI